MEIIPKQRRRHPHQLPPPPPELPSHGIQGGEEQRIGSPAGPAGRVARAPTTSRGKFRGPLMRGRRPSMASYEAANEMVTRLEIGDCDNELIDNRSASFANKEAEL